MACPEVRLVEVMMVVKFQECRYEISKHKKSTILCGEQFKHIKVAATGYSYQMVVPTIKISGPSLKHTPPLLPFFLRELSSAGWMDGSPGDGEL